tara:strand:+ start:77 stop:292 length:216 start_codon:yes stop_codon:yes gene_type:complete
VVVLEVQENQIEMVVMVDQVAVVVLETAQVVLQEQETLLQLLQHKGLMVDQLLLAVRVLIEEVVVAAVVLQ